MPQPPMPEKWMRLPASESGRVSDEVGVGVGFSLMEWAVGVAGDLVWVVFGAGVIRECIPGRRLF